MNQFFKSAAIGFGLLVAIVTIGVLFIVASEWIAPSSQIELRSNR